MMGATTQGIEPGAADALLNLLDLIANPDRAKALAQEMREAAALLDKAAADARTAQAAADMAHDDAVERIGAAVDAEKKSNAALEKLKAARSDADKKAASTKAEIAEDRRTLKAECDAAAVAAGDARARFASEQDRLDRVDAGLHAVAAMQSAKAAELDTREEALKAAESDLAERLAKLKALAG